MFLLFYYFLFQVDSPCSAWLFEGQYILQGVLVIVCVLMVPIMLIPKPFILRSRHRAKVLAMASQAEVLQGELVRKPLF